MREKQVKSLQNTLEAKLLEIENKLECRIRQGPNSLPDSKSRRRRTKNISATSYTSTNLEASISGKQVDGKLCEQGNTAEKLLNLGFSNTIRLRNIHEQP